MDSKETSKLRTVSDATKLAIENGIMCIEFREGIANALPDPVKPSFQGVITTPSDYMESRPEEFNIEKSLAIFDRNGMQIILTDDTRGNYAVSVLGKLDLSKTLKAISINKGHKYTPEELAKLPRLKRSWFEDFGSHAEIIGQLRNVKAKVNAEVEKSSDNGGNKTELFRVAVESNMPDSFKFKAKIFEGEEEQSFTVDFVLSVDNGGIVCELESMELEEAIENGIELIFDREKQMIQDKATIIYKS